MIRYALIFALCIGLNGADYYVSPSATSGTGTIGDPWNIVTALTNSLVHSNTLWLRGGTYRGNYNSTLNYATVRSYTNEWAIFTDGAFGNLDITCDATTNHIYVTGASTWQSAQVVIIGIENLQLSSLVNGTNWIVNRGWNGTTAAVHSANSRVILRAPIIQHSGTNTTFRDFEISGTTTTNRNVGTNWANSGGIDCAASGVGSKLINLIINNCGHPAIGFWSQGDAEISGCILWGNGMYDYDPGYANGVGTARGSGIYAQNTTNLTTVKNLISFRNITTGGKVFGETGGVKGFKWIDCVSFQAGVGEPALEASSGSTSMSNVWFQGNMLMGRPMLSYASLSNVAEYVINNYFINGYMSVSEHTSSVYTNNVIYLVKGAAAGDSPNYFSNTKTNKAQLDIVWDYNQYYVSSNGSISQWAFHAANVNSFNSQGAGILDYVDGTNSWTSWSGFDTHGTYGTNWPTNMIVRVMTNDYDANRWHICVVNTTSSNTVNFQLSSVGMSAGQSYSLTDVQNWPAVSMSGVYDGSSPIALPLSATNVSVINGTLTNTTNEHTNVRYPGLFNTFVLTRSQSAAGTLAQTGPGQSRSRGRR